MNVSVLRLFHRYVRDERVTSHVFLVARAFGADEGVYTGKHDESIEKSLESIKANWGGTFSIRYEKDFLDVIKEYKNKGYKIVHLTMYGMPLSKKIDEIKTHKKILVVVGGEKVPPSVYNDADYNVAVTNQPHSEVGALAIMLDRLMEGKELEEHFDDRFKGKIKIEPKEKGKRTLE